MDSLDCARQRIRAFIAGSMVPEDPQHAENTLQWLLRLRPDAGPALQLAALAHDIERARPDRYRREQFDHYDSFKAAHAERGARLLREILQACEVDESIAAEACRLVRLHETGGDADADSLCDADSLSYFDINLPLYYQREGPAETLRRCRWGLQRLSPDARPWLAQLQHHPPHLRHLIQQAMAETSR